MADDTDIDILGLTRRGFESAAGLGPGRSRALGFLYKAAQLEGRFEPEGAGISRDAKALLRRRFRVGLLEPVKVVEEEGALGVTAKALMRLTDGECVECVRIPAAQGGVTGARATICLSSQVGCRMGCAFCETGKRGLVRNLLTAEIVSQLVTAELLLGWRISNIVFMGMGEPLDNFEALSGALAVFLDASGPGLRFSQEEITVCTVGPARRECRRLARSLGYKRLNLSVSLNASG